MAGDESVSRPEGGDMKIREYGWSVAWRNGDRITQAVDDEYREDVYTSAEEWPEGSNIARLFSAIAREHSECGEYEDDALITLWENARRYELTMANCSF